MRWFLDMCVILFYVGEGDNGGLVEKAKNFVDDKEDKLFLVCCYIRDENMPKWLRRQRVLFREMIRQIKDLDYKPYSSKESSGLKKRDKNKIIKLKTLFRNASDGVEIVNKFQKAYNELEKRIDLFFRDKVDEFVVPIMEIDFDLRSCLFTWLNPNDSDAKTIASAVQEHNKNGLVILTADKKDWNADLLGEVHNDFELKSKYSKLPEIKYVQELKC